MLKMLQKHLFKCLRFMNLLSKDTLEILSYLECFAIRVGVSNVIFANTSMRENYDHNMYLFSSFMQSHIRIRVFSYNKYNGTP